MDGGALWVTVHGVAKELDMPYLSLSLSHTHTHTQTFRIFLIKDIGKQLAVLTPASLSVALHTCK